jgi:hypothetical protein
MARKRIQQRKRLSKRPNRARSAAKVVDLPIDYWVMARQPLHCLIFLAPLLVIYEAGVIVLANGDSSALRNGADYWMRGWLASIGFRQALILPCLVVGAMLVWQIAGRYSWQVKGTTIVGMIAESLLFAVFLMVMGQLHDLLFDQLSIDRTASMGHSSSANRVVAFIGAGVYEEVMFRLCLLPIGYAVFRVFNFPPKWAAGMAVFTTSMIFAFAHYIGPGADHFSMFSFTFRAIAGIFFAGLFFVRGFGITVGSHAAYDLLVGVLLVSNDVA